tara:strand:- start:4356 stop:5219 length:864 start_codon:yes stop_codon:yes gene_type:complete
MIENNFLKYYSKFLIEYKESGLISSIKKVISFLTHLLKTKFYKSPILKRKIFLSKKLNDQFNGIIRYGPFKNLKFIHTSWWGIINRAAMLLGIYEQEIIESFNEIPKKHDVFINLGAADGYYGIGALLTKNFNKSYCYEMSKLGQSSIDQNAKLNKVSDKIIIRGLAEKNFYKDFSPEEIEKSVLFVDIEGGEFDLFDQNLFKVFKKSIIYIELHDRNKDFNKNLDKMISDSKDYFTIKELTTTKRDMSKFKELENFSDDDRWLICSEGRSKLMKWWKFEPISHTNS